MNVSSNQSGTSLSRAKYSNTPSLSRERMSEGTKSLPESPVTKPPIQPNMKTRPLSGKNQPVTRTNIQTRPLSGVKSRPGSAGVTRKDIVSRKGRIIRRFWKEILNEGALIGHQYYLRN